MDEKTDTSDVVVKKGSSMGSLVRLVKGSLMSSPVMGSLSGNLVENGTPVRNSLMGTHVRSLGHNFVMHDNGIVHLMMVGTLCVNDLAAMLEEDDAQEAGMQQ